MAAILPCVFASGVLIGATLTAYAVRGSSPPRIIEDDATGVPVVTIEGILDGALSGRAEGNVRIGARGELVPVDGSGSFRITDRALLTNTVTLRAPAWARFVASRRGKIYWPLSSSEAARIVLENRLYFRTAVEAEGAGYRR